MTTTRNSRPLRRIRPQPPKTHEMCLRSDSRRSQAVPLPVGRAEADVPTAEEKLRQVRALLQERDETIARLQEEVGHFRALAEATAVQEARVQDEDGEMAALPQLEGVDKDDVRVRYADKFGEWSEMQRLLYYDYEIVPETEVVRFWNYLVSSCPALRVLQLHGEGPVLARSIVENGDDQVFEDDDSENENMPQRGVFRPVFDGSIVEEVGERGIEEDQDYSENENMSPRFLRPVHDVEAVDDQIFDEDEDEDKENMPPRGLFQAVDDQIFDEDEDEDKENMPPRGFTRPVLDRSIVEGIDDQVFEEDEDEDKENMPPREFLRTIFDGSIVEEVGGQRIEEDQDDASEESSLLRGYYLAPPPRLPRSNKRAYDSVDDSEDEARKRFRC